jgi:hypothetical protein
MQEEVTISFVNGDIIGSRGWGPGAGLEGCNEHTRGLTDRGRDSGRPLPPRTDPYERLSRIRLLSWMLGLKAYTRVRV